jgi:hypothetical protein
MWHSRPSQRRMVSPADNQDAAVWAGEGASPASWDWHGPVAGTGARVGSDDTLGHGQEQPPVRIDGDAVRDGLLRLGTVENHVTVDAGCRLGDDGRGVVRAAESQHRQHRPVLCYHKVRKRHLDLAAVRRAVH